jgi:tetratricopeptide (TPR) repeat protein
MRHGAGVRQVAFSSDGRSLLTTGGGTVRQWAAPVPLPDDLPRLVPWVEAIVGLEMNEQGSFRPLDRAGWLERQSRLEQLGGPPSLDPAPRLDPILFGADPTARGDAWKKRGLFDQAEAAFVEAIDARPHNRSVWYALACLHLERDHREWAATTLTEAVRLIPEDLFLRRVLSHALLWSGDGSAWRSSNAALVSHFGGTSNAWLADQIVGACVLGPEGTVDLGVPVRLAEAAVKGYDGVVNRANAMNRLGAALYRAGRFADAIRQLDEGIRLKGGVSPPHHHAFLALAHHRLGHRDEARRWLDRLREQQPSTDSTQFWNELEIRLLRSEAEAVILYDPVFPADPFAR